MSCKSIIKADDTTTIKKQKQ